MRAQINRLSSRFGFYCHFPFWGVRNLPSQQTSVETKTNVLFTKQYLSLKYNILVPASQKACDALQSTSNPSSHLHNYFNLHVCPLLQHPSVSCVHNVIVRDKDKLHISKLTLVFHYLPSVSPKQLCASAHLGCTHEVGTS